MATKPELIIDDLVKVLEGGIDDFNNQIPELQSQMYREALDLVSDLETTSTRPKRLIVSIKNVRIMAKIKAKMKDAIINDEYIKSVDSYLKTWDKIDKINNTYFSTITARWKPSTVFEELKKQSIEQVRENMLGSGIDGNIVNRLNNILQENITTGGTYAGFTEQLRTFLMTDEKGDGALAKYAKTYVNDAVSQYNRQYHQLATNDLGLKWYKYVGSLKETSREFCVKLIEAKKTCMPFIHESQVAELLKGHICGERVKMNERTELPEGFMAGTTVQTFIGSNAAGYFCGHQMIPVDESLVPDYLVEQFSDK